MNISNLNINNMIRPFKLTIEAVSSSSSKKSAGARLAQIRKTFLKHSPPIIIGDYLGSGGFSDVFSARSEYLSETEFAIKILRSGLMKPRSGEHFNAAREEMRVKDIKKRFTNESYVQWDLSQNLSDRVSESVVKVYDHGEFDTRQQYRFILMERMQSTLREFINSPAAKDNTPQMLRYKALLLTKIADIIYNVHQEGIFHRDIKPENIFFGREEADSCAPSPASTGRRSYELEHRVKLGDFGTVRWVKTYDDNFDGIIIGSQWYLSPEQIYNPETLDVRTDIYSFGVVGYEVFYGAHPKDVNEDTSNLIVKLAQAAPVPRTPPEGFEALHGILFKCLEDVETRYQSMGDVVGELRQFIGGLPNRGD